LSLQTETKGSKEATKVFFKLINLQNQFWIKRKG